MSSSLGIAMCEKCNASVGYFQGIWKSSISSTVTVKMSLFLYAYVIIGLWKLQENCIYSFSY